MDSAIEPGLLSIYSWDSKQDKDTFTIIASIPEGINKNDISVQAVPEQKKIKCSIRGKLPFLSGKTFSGFSKVKHSVKDSIFQLEFQKDTQAEWPFLIVSALSKTCPMDPQSMYILSVVYAHQDKQMQSFECLMASSHFMFPQAILTLAQIYVRDKQNVPNPIDLLKRLVVEYKIYEAAFAIGEMSILNVAPINDAIEYLQIGVSANNVQCALLLGIFKNPCEEPHGEFENADEAWNLLDMAKDHPRAQYSIGLMKFNGIGCQRNIEEARAIVSQVRKELPDLPDLPTEVPSAPIVKETPTVPGVVNREETPNPSSNKLIICLASIGALAFGTLAYRFFKRNKK